MALAINNIGNAMSDESPLSLIERSPFPDRYHYFALALASCDRIAMRPITGTQRVSDVLVTTIVG